MNLRIAVIGPVLFWTCALQAQTFEISPHYGYRWGGSLEDISGESIDFKDGPTYGLALNYTPNEELDVKYELLWTRQESGLDLEDVGGPSDLDMTIDEIMIGGVLETHKGKACGYVTGLVGATLFSPEDADSEVRFSLSVGVGAKYFLTRNLALRADIRGFCTIVESEGAFIYANGVSVAYFSGSSLWQGEVSAGVTLAF